MYRSPNKGKNAGSSQSSYYPINAPHFWLYPQQCAFPPQFTPLCDSDYIPILRPSCPVSKLIFEAVWWGLSEHLSTKIKGWFHPTVLHNFILMYLDTLICTDFVPLLLVYVSSIPLQLLCSCSGLVSVEINSIVWYGSQEKGKMGECGFIVLICYGLLREVTVRGERVKILLTHR